MATPRDEEYERAAAGMDYDFPMREKASHLGSVMAENGPDALLEEIEKMLPDSWREHITTFPVAAMLLGFGVGIWLGMRKGNGIIAAGTSMVTAAAMANVTHVMERATGSE